MSSIKIKCAPMGTPGLFVVDGHDLSNYVLRDSITLDPTGDMWVVRIALAGDIEVELPDSILEVERDDRPRRLCEGEVD